MMVEITILVNSFLPAIEKRQFIIPIAGIDKQNKIVKNHILAELTIEGEKNPAVWQEGKHIRVLFSPEKSLELILNERLIQHTQPFYTKLPIHYHAIPGNLRKLLGQVLLKTDMINATLHDIPFFPSFPIDYSVYFLLQLMSLTQTSVKTPVMRPPLPVGKKFVLCLTHDVDSAQGYKQINALVSLEKEYKLTSTYFFPTHLYQIDFNHLTTLETEGFEIGIHGYNHDGKLAFLSKGEMRKRLQSGYSKFNQYLHVSGFRSPAYLRTSELFKQLQEFYTYDSSVPDTHNYRNSKPNYGCCSLYPYIKQGNLLELPVTLPDDATLLLYGFSPEQILNTWQKKMRKIKELAGVAVLLTHPEPHFSGNREMLSVYERFLQEVARDRTCWITTCGKISQNLKPYQ